MHLVPGGELEVRQGDLEGVEGLVGRPRRAPPRTSGAAGATSSTQLLVAVPATTDGADDDTESLYDAPEFLYEPLGSDVSAGYASPACTEDDDGCESLVSSPSAACTSPSDASRGSSVCGPSTKVRAYARPEVWCWNL